MSIQSTTAQHSTPLSSNHHTKKYLQDEFIISQPSKEPINSQNKLLFFPKLKQQSNKASLSPLILSQLPLFNPSYLSKPQWQNNHKKLTSLLDKANKKHDKLTSSPALPMVLLKGTHHPSSLETEAQPESLSTTLISGKQLTNTMTP